MGENSRGVGGSLPPKLIRPGWPSCSTGIPRASKLLRDWDGQTVWVAPDEVHEREVRVFQVQTTLGGMVTISGHECISGVSNDVALGRASRAAEARRERAAAAQEDAALPCAKVVSLRR